MQTELFTGKKEKYLLKEVCSIDTNTIKPNEYLNLPYMGLEDIEAETGDINYKSIEKSKNVLSICYLFTNKHVLYSKLRPYLNKVALPTINGRCTTELIPLMPNQYITREYLAFWLRRPQSIEYIMQEKNGARMPRADLKHLLNMPIEFPVSVIDQNTIVNETNNQLNLIKSIQKQCNEIIESTKIKRNIILENFGKHGQNNE